MGALCQGVSRAVAILSIGVVIGCAARSGEPELAAGAGAGSSALAAGSGGTEAGGTGGSSGAGQSGQGDSGVDGAAGGGATGGGPNDEVGINPDDFAALEPTDAIPGPTIWFCAPTPDIGTGIARGLLNGDDTVLNERVALNRPGGPENAVSGLFANAHGYVTGGTNGFWVIDDALNGQLVRAIGERVTRFRFVDLDGDGDEDAVVESSWTSGGTFIHALTAYARAGSTLARQGRIVMDSIAPFLELGAIADVDGDNDPDVVHFEAGAPMLYRNEGRFAFKRMRAGAVEPGLEAHTPEAFLLQDDDGDGTLDFTVSLNSYPEEPSAVTVHWWRGAGDGTFQLQASQRFDTAVSIGELGDKTGDGIADAVLLFYEEGVPINYIARGTAPGAFDTTALQELSEPSEPVLNLTDSEGWVGSAVREDSSGAKTLAVLVHAPCPLRCDDSCPHACIFEACTECLTHADCGGDRCINGACTPAP